MADNTTGLPVKSLDAESVRAKLVDSTNTNVAAISAAGRISVDGTGGAFPVSGTVAVSSITTAVVPGTAATNLGKAEDAAHTTGDTGVMMLAVRNDAGTALADTTLDYIPITTDNTGALRVTGGSGGQQYSEDAASAGAELLTLAGAVRQDTIASSTTLDGDYAYLKVSSVGRLYTSATVDAALPAGTNNIGDVDVLTVPAPLNVVGNGAAATALRVTLANDSTGTTAVTQATAASLNATVVGGAAHDAVVAGNPLLLGGYASAAAPAAVTADGDAVRLWALRSGALATQITAAGALIGGDAPNGLDVDVTRLPALVAGTANIGDVDVLTVPAPLSTTGNGTAATALRVTLSSDSTGIVALTGSLPAGVNNIGDVDVLTLPANASVNVTQIAGAAPSATAFMPSRLTDGTAYYTNTGQTAGTAAFGRITDATNTAAVIATINSLKVDLSSYAGAVPSATNAVPVRLTDGAAFYASASGAPTDPKFSTQTSAALGAGASATVTHYVTSGKTGHLTGVDVASTIPMKVVINTVVTGTPTARVILFTLAGQPIIWRAPFKTYITRASADASSGFSVTITNKDNATAADIYSTAFWDEV